MGPKGKAKATEWLDLTGDSDSGTPPVWKAPHLRRVEIDEKDALAFILPKLAPGLVQLPSSTPRPGSSNSKSVVPRTGPSTGSSRQPVNGGGQPAAMGLSAKALGKQAELREGEVVRYWLQTSASGAAAQIPTEAMEVLVVADSDDEGDVVVPAGPSTPRTTPAASIPRGSPSLPPDARAIKPPFEPARDIRPDCDSASAASVDELMMDARVPPPRQNRARKSTGSFRQTRRTRTCAPRVVVDGPAPAAAEGEAGPLPRGGESSTKRAPSPRRPSPPLKKKRGRAVGSESKQKLGKRLLDPSTRFVMPGDELQEENGTLYWAFSQNSKPAWLRSVTGPKLAKEFTSRHYDAIQRLPKTHISSPTDTALYQAFVDDVNTREIPRKASIRICPPPASSSGPFAPPFNTYYTNRIIYPDGVVPEQADGCKCEGRCQDPHFRDSCECRKRQEAACRSRPGRLERSGNVGFAYGDDGTIRWEGEDPERLAPIIECGARCGCPPGCVNRAAGDGPNVNLDLFWTGNRGWGVRNRPKKDGGALIKKGTPLGVYAGELLGDAAVERREKEHEARGEVFKNYLYDLDHWHLHEDFRDSRGDTLPSEAGGPVPDAEALEEYYASFYYTVDAHKYGNFTRYCNHSCIPNSYTRAVYIDDALITRPLHVFFSSKDIRPGEEITISYYSTIEARLAVGQTLKAYKALAEARRARALPDLRCLCGLDLCRGVMFRRDDD